MNWKQSFILKIASIICKSKGNNSVQFEEHMLRGCHPLAVTGMADVLHLREKLDEVCAMKFIYKIGADGKRLNQHYDDDLFVDGEDDENTNDVPTLNKKPSYMNFEVEPPSLAAGSPKGNKTKNDENVFHVDGTDFDGITDPMPSTKALLQQPSKSVPYKKVCHFVGSWNVSGTELSGICDVFGKC